MLPSGMNTPWAGSDRYKDFGAQYHSQPDGHARSVHPRVLSVYASTSDFGSSPYTLAVTLDTGPLARSYPGGIYPRLSSNHFQFARPPLVRRHGSSPAGLSVGDRRPSGRRSSYRIARRAAIFFLEHRSAAAEPGQGRTFCFSAGHSRQVSVRQRWTKRWRAEKWGPAQRAEGAIPFFVIPGFCLFSSGFWSSGLFSGPGSSSDSRSPGPFPGPGFADERSGSRGRRV
jgi:hypothetical protein